MAVAAMAWPVGAATTNYTILRSFGFVDQAGEDPDVIIEGRDGVLYGSASIGSSFFWNASSDNPSRSLIYKMEKNGTGYVILHRFTQTNQFVTELLHATNGVLYGATSAGGRSDRGIIFRLNTDGSGYAVLHELAGDSGDGENPRGLMQAGDGGLYGTTVSGGTSANCPGGCGTAFRINLDGTGYTLLRSLSGSITEGRHPMAGLVEGADGLLYGTTRQGGAANAGTVFKLSRDGSAYTTIVNFHGTNGSFPTGALLQTGDGVLYGTTENGGGAADAGTYFRVNTDGTDHRILHYFAGGIADGRTPTARLVEGADGAIYGSTRPSGHTGTIFKSNKDGSSYQVLQTNLWLPRLIAASDGLLYGAQLREVFRISNAGVYESLRPFTAGAGDGTGPFVLIEGSDNFLYGLTIWGGHDYNGAGAVFKLAKDGSDYSVLRYFTNVPSGAGRPRSLIEGSDGVLYGSLDFGGAFGGGFIYTMNKDGTAFHPIFNFDGTNGAGPAEGLIEGSDGVLYGIAEHGGTARRGVAYRMNKDGSGYTVLHAFGGSPLADAAHPGYGLLEATDGWLYGESPLGGSASRGMIFKFRKNGTGYHELYNFADLTSFSSGPCGGLIEAANGEIYGATIAGGDADAGTIFKIKKDGTGYTRLLSFPPGSWYFRDSKRIMQGSDGALYGVTFTGVSIGQGTVYRINSDGSGYQILHDFVNAGGDGGGPWGEFIEGRDGALYGATSWGGALNVGTIFRYVPQPEIIARRTDGQVALTARGLSGSTLAIEASADLSAWIEVAAGPLIDGRFTADDLTATSHQHRFYRARVQ